MGEDGTWDVGDSDQRRIAEAQRTEADSPLQCCSCPDIARLICQSGAPTYVQSLFLDPFLLLRNFRAQNVIKILGRYDGGKILPKYLG